MTQQHGEATSLICALCRGAGSRFCMQNGEREWWDCQACGGTGVRVQFGPALIVPRRHSEQK
jgi:hypothetical protein